MSSTWMWTVFLTLRASQLCVVMPAIRTGRTQAAGTLNVAVFQLPDGSVRMSQDR